jgi:DNA-binding LytR/AlgR family response regulator
MHSVAWGMQVHRSYWASYDHMNRLVRREGRMLLRLTDDREVPVSRPYLKAVRAVLSKEAARPPTQG